MKSFDAWQADPQVVGVEDLELGDGFELVYVSFGHLGDLQQPEFTVKLRQGTTLKLYGKDL